MNDLYNELNSIQEKASIEKDILDREQIINIWKQSGWLDRSSAVRKIIELQNKDTYICAATNVVKLQRGGVDLNYVPDNVIIENLQFQIDCLKGKLAEKMMEDKNEH